MLAELRERMAAVRGRRIWGGGFWQWPIAAAAWFISTFWALMYFNLEGSHLYHPNHGGPVAAGIAGVLCVLTTCHVVHTFVVLTSRRRP